MIDYFKEEEFYQSQAQRKKVLILFFVLTFVYLAISVGMLLWYLTLPYQSPTITTVKLIQYPVSALWVIFAFIYLGIPYKRVNRHYRMMRNLMTGLRETSTGSFFEYDETLQDKDGVDFKSLIFLEWNRYKQDFFERKVLVFDEKEFPEFEVNANVRYVTQGNVLVSYEIIDDEMPAQTEKTETEKEI